MIAIANTPIEPDNRCPICSFIHAEGECLPIAAPLAPRELMIDDRVAYDGFRRSEWAEEQYRKDHEGWIKLT